MNTDSYINTDSYNWLSYMNYQKIHDSLIERARKRELIIGQYYEKHHIVPRCMGGGDEENNLVKLTAREHFLVHLLLSKIFGGKLVYAAHMMSNMKRYSSRRYEKLRMLHRDNISKLLSGRTLAEEHKDKIANNKERAKKISKSLSGKRKSEEHVKKWKKSRMEGAGFVVSEEQKKKTSEALKGEKNPMYGKTHTDTAIKKIREANRQKAECPYCGKMGGKAIMKRWHFDNCKHK